MGETGTVAPNPASSKLSGRLLIGAAALLWITFAGPMVLGQLGVPLSSEHSELAWTVSGVLFVIVAGLMIWHAAALYRCHDLDRLWPAMLTVKIVAIPFFVVNFVFWWFVVSGTLFFGIGFFIWPFAVAITYAALLPTSAYGIATLLVLKERRTVSATYLVVNLLLHLTFVLDVVSAVVVAMRARDVATARRRPAPAAGVS